ncbi:acyl-CoA dehydrogenase [Natrinema longum]|uniref:acyl-CoA dehydrogenase n=1 Tax=Natrinema longum TaxID=370324 RepID=UPI001CCF61A9|nr:acyl-CoA dehydrogenase [Natrinema longum]MBZ6496806.1 acyl-CoA dehydrogenase [Natrinema longum]
MTNFKSGSGNLDFGADEDPEPDSSDLEDETDTGTQPDPDSASTEVVSSPPETSPNSTDGASDRPQSNQVTTEESRVSDTPTNEYPYFVRRSNVGDERDTRLEIHVRDKVADREAEFRSELAAHLDANEIAKTDAREFALLAAFRYPERVAELMSDEGFGALD